MCTATSTSHRPIRPMAVAVIACSFLAATSCGSGGLLSGGEIVRGSGDLESETHGVEGFDSLLVDGQGEIVVVVDGTESLTVTADDNVLPHLTIEVNDDRLELGVDDDIQLSSATVRYAITADALESVEIRGSGDVLATAIDVDEFGVQISGSGDVEPVGVAETIVVEIDGSGNVDAAAFEAERGMVEINGSGDVTINATRDLEIEINGSGDVRYLGEPEIDETISGSGGVSPA